LPRPTRLGAKSWRAEVFCFALRNGARQEVRTPDPAMRRLVLRIRGSDRLSPRLLLRVKKLTSREWPLLARSGHSSSMRSTWFTEPSSGDQSSGTSSEARFIYRASDRERTSQGRRDIAAILATSFHAHIASRRFRRSSFRSSATDAYATP